MYECATCEDTFYSRDECDEHMDDYDHWVECDSCDRTFRSQRACDQHMDALDHHRLFECETCTSQFRSQAGVERHMRELDHWSTYCVPCDREFNSENNLRMHRNSRIHRSSGVLCPFCKTEFVTASGASHHVETGSCSNAPTLNRESIHRLIRASDSRGLITNQQIEWHEENVKYSVTNAAYNGTAWECYCCHRGFRTPAALTQHLNSPIHKQRIYHCPNGNCPKEFNSLAGLFSHLESESCKFMRFERVQQVQKNLNDAITGGRRLLTI
ncbi:hypothetical protein N7520_000806 [Penicillium odoratum]|uniref:uncharacterized protein n=1 Tax=Penicillium odoratum TaxID=1167516 RepID=UPI00254728FC|nr:uncharacterized protein N7520_000806 [Penicillium odoratum]KAJ5777560.1 hypothetical protein N7520_000806 [Penicillium odoratum]